MDIRYPIGSFQPVEEITSNKLEAWINDIEELPALLRNVVKNLSNEKVDTPYRPGGWTVRQVIHHLADSHMNAYIRLKLTLTEETPTVKAYDENKWAELVDYSLPIETSLLLLESLHVHWTYLLRHLTPEDMKRKFLHPENGEVTLDRLIALYAWHGKHHVAHITSLCARMGWT